MGDGFERKSALSGGTTKTKCRHEKDSKLGKSAAHPTTPCPSLVVHHVRLYDDILLFPS